MTQVQIKPKIKELKIDINKIEKIVSQWEKDFKIKEISKLSKSSYDSFVNLQLNIASIVDSTQKKDCLIDCYKLTYDFLSFVESEINEDLAILLLNYSKDFSKLFNEYSKYCTKIEKKYELSDGMS